MLVTILLAFVTACASSTEQRTRTALDVIGEVVGPASAAAADICKQQESAIMAEARAQGFKQAYADELEAVSARCLKTADAFEQIKTAHDTAVKFADSGKLDEARAMLAKIMAAWAALKGGS